MGYGLISSHLLLLHHYHLVYLLCKSFNVLGVLFLCRSRFIPDTLEPKDSKPQCDSSTPGRMIPCFNVQDSLLQHSLWLLNQHQYMYDDLIGP